MIHQPGMQAVQSTSAEQLTRRQPGMQAVQSASRQHPTRELCVQAAQSEVGRAGLGPLCQVTLGYNRARAQEACGQLHTAAATYKGILDQLPGAQPWLRLPQPAAAIWRCGISRGHAFTRARRQMHMLLCPV